MRSLLSQTMSSTSVYARNCTELWKIVPLACVFTSLNFLELNQAKPSDVPTAGPKTPCLTSLFGHLCSPTSYITRWRPFTKWPSHLKLDQPWTGWFLPEVAAKEASGSLILCKMAATSSLLAINLPLLS